MALPADDLAECSWFRDLDFFFGLNKHFITSIFFSIEPILRKGTTLAKCFSFHHARIFLYQQYRKCFGFFISNYAYIEMIGPQISATYPTHGNPKIVVLLLK